jgi:hypothetical protein
LTLLIQRLQFYAHLMRLPRLTTVELDVSDWQPAPTSGAAYRALASELRLYNSNITRVVFVYEYERTLVRALPDGLCKVDLEASVEELWREV